MLLQRLDDIEIYDEKKPIGRGAFSRVFKCRHKNNHRIYALKQIDMERLSQADCNNLRNEIDIQEGLDHPNLTRYYDCLQIDDIVYILLEYAGNYSLFDYIHDSKGLPEKLALRFLFQSALGVKYLLEHNIMHRDIKPENLLLTEHFHVKICDFGWSCRTNSDSKTRSTLCGTFEYMAPEVYNGLVQGPQIDVWSLGILLYEMITGSPPHKGCTISALKKEFEEKPIQIPENISLETQDLMKGMLDPLPEKRLTIQQILNHKAFSSNFREFYRDLRFDEKELLSEAYNHNHGGQNLKLIKEIESLIKKSDEQKKLDDRFFPKKQPDEVLPENVAKGKKVINLGDPLSKTVKVEQNYVYTDKKQEEKEKEINQSVAWKRITTLNLGS